MSTLLKTKWLSVSLMAAASLAACDSSSDLKSAKELCSNGKLDSGETDVDCGGNKCLPCEEGAACLVDDDCAGALGCTANKTCGDICFSGAKDGDETDVDCGGACEPCGPGLGCGADQDCQEGYICNPNNVCAIACQDGVKDYEETDIDCGGPECMPCGPDAACTDGADCRQPLACVENKCVDTCGNGVQDVSLGETDVDCGGPVCSRCLAPQHCSKADDCEHGLSCVDMSGTNQCVDLCANGVLDADNGETSIDCGGSACKLCDVGQTCAIDKDCASNLCDAGFECALGGSQPLALVDICALYNNYQLDSRQTIVTQQGSYPDLCMQKRALTALDYDDAVLAWTCRAGSEGLVWAEALVSAADAGLVVIDWTKARNCLAQSRYLRSANPAIDLLSSSQWADLRTGDCATFFHGTVAQDGLCADEWDCQAGLGCYAASLYDTQLRCMPPAGLGEDCHAARACDSATICSESSGKCMERGAEGDYCEAHSDCVSGYCGSDGCAAAPTKAMGEQCASVDECLGAEGGCMSCRPSTQGAQDTCQPYGGEGDYCRDWTDCAWDLGCTSGVCTAVGRGRPCGSATSQSMCREGYYCVPAMDCSTILDEAACAAQGICGWDSENGCVATEGMCIELPTSDACYEGSCAQGYYCDGDDVCQPMVDAGGLCDTADACHAEMGYGCFDGTCQQCGVTTDCCVVDADCGDDNEYCNSDYNTCVTYAGATCEPSGAACRPGFGCLTPEEYCGRYPATAEDCGIDIACQLVTDVCSFVTDCYSQDAPDCTDGCVLVDDPLYGLYCDVDPELDCGALTDTCTETPGCALRDVCDAVVSSEDATCIELLGGGQMCNPELEGADCSTATCTEDPTDNVFKCEVVDSCATTTRLSSILQMSFLFGSVLILRRRRMS